VTEPILAGAENSTSNGTANEGTQWISEAVGFWPVFVLLVSFFGIIVYAVYVRGVRR